MSSHPTRSLPACVFGVALIASNGVYALESDRNQTLEFSADGDSTMRIADNTRIVEMSGNVRVVQGTLKILGDEAIFEYDATTNELTRVTVHGMPVDYRQQLDEDGTIVIGSGDTIVFYTDDASGESVIELIGNAIIEDPETTWSCTAITYFVDSKLIPQSTGPCEGSLAGTNQ